MNAGARAERGAGARIFALVKNVRGDPRKSVRRALAESRRQTACGSDLHESHDRLGQSSGGLRCPSIVRLSGYLRNLRNLRKDLSGDGVDCTQIAQISQIKSDGAGAPSLHDIDQGQGFRQRDHQLQHQGARASDRAAHNRRARQEQRRTGGTAEQPGHRFGETSSAGECEEGGAAAEFGEEETAEKREGIRRG